jgi:hypothetical protein
MLGRTRLRIAKVSEVVVLAAIPIVSAVKAAYPQAATPETNLLQHLHRVFLERYVWIVALLGAAGAIAKLTQELLNPESKIRLRSTLDTLLDAYFPDVPEDQRYHNRVTLFKASRGTDRLKPHCRSGTQYQRKIQSFAINDNDEGANEGIVGQAWFRNATVYATGLPECPEVWRDDDAACVAYAQRSLLPVTKAGRLHVKSRSYVATPVRDLKGSKWGVLVLDSRQAAGVDRDPTRDRLVRTYAAALGKML